MKKPCFPYYTFIIRCLVLIQFSVIHGYGQSRIFLHPDDLLQIQIDSCLIKFEKLVIERDSTDLALAYNQKAFDLAVQTENQEARFHALINFGIYQERLRNLPEANKYLDQAIALADSINDLNLQQEAYYRKAHCVTGEARLAEGIKWIEKSYQINLKTNASEKVLIRTLSFLGYWNGQLGSFDLAYEYLSEAIDLARADSLEYFNSYLYTLYSNTAIFEGDYKLALEYELQSLYYAEKADDAYRIAICRHNLSDIYYFLGDLGKALEECKLIESQIELIGDERVAAEFQKRLGNIYFQMHDLVKSRQAFENAYTIYDKVIDNLGKAKTILEMTPLLIAEGSFDKAEEQLKTSIFGLIELGDSVLLMKSHKALGDLWQNQELFEKARHEYLSTYSYFQQNGFLEESAQICISLVESYNSSGNPDSALWYADKGLEFYLEAGSKKGLADIYEIRYKLFRETGDLAQALHNHELFYAYTDSIKTEDAQRRFMEESVRQNVENIEKEKELVEIQNQLLFSRNRLYLILGGLLILVAGLLLWSYRNIRRSKNRIARQNLELEEMNQTKDRFFSIIAHDLRSPIVGLQGVGMQMAYYLEKNKPEELANVTRLVDETTTRLNQLLDNLLSWALSQTNSFPFSADWNPVRLMIEDTVKIFTPLAEAKNLQFKINTPSELQVFGDDRALRTVFRNLISNAVKFSKKDGQVIITARMVRQQLEVAVQDSGIGLPAEKLEELYSLKKMIQKGSSGEPGTGLGLVLCQYLMELHQGKIWAESEEGKGATFIISLPQPALIPSVETIKKEDKLVSV